MKNTFDKLKSILDSTEAELSQFSLTALKNPQVPLSFKRVLLPAVLDTLPTFSELVKSGRQSGHQIDLHLTLIVAFDPKTNANLLDAIADNSELAERYFKNPFKVV